MNNPTNNPRVALKPEDFDDLASGLIIVAGAALLGTVADIAYHHTNPVEGWSPYSRPGNAADLLIEVRDHVERLEEAVKKARRQLAAVERPARLAAYRRTKREESR